MGYLLFPIFVVMGLRLAALRAAEAPLKIKKRFTRVTLSALKTKKLFGNLFVLKKKKRIELASLSEIIMLSILWGQ